ncbi:MAG TPA: metalloregulator ArsR/SmtB family transcription factor [Myxococcales bacterium]|jgi:ArsR family transcriptional regulator, arsenate/arsenite/antimonite-responsive transcriptional repressor|nr:metalloregulator ArsR/SmtB family transcription factor [Myxococcales bacterium]
MDESRVVKVARAIADSTRYRMLQEIQAAGEMTCGELQARFPLSQATVSHHIKTLEQAGLLRVRPQGLFRHLSAEPGCVSAFANRLLEKLCGAVQAAGVSAPERKARRPRR